MVLPLKRSPFIAPLRVFWYTYSPHLEYINWDYSYWIVSFIHSYYLIASFWDHHFNAQKFDKISKITLLENLPYWGPSDFNQDRDSPRWPLIQASVGEPGADSLAIFWGGLKPSPYSTNGSTKPFKVFVRKPSINATCIKSPLMRK